MRGLFILSYALLWVLVVTESVLLREVLRGTIWFKRLQNDFSRRRKSVEPARLPAGSPAPDFIAPLLWTGESLSTSQLKGHPSILVFVSPEEVSPLYKNLASAIHAMWHETNGHVYFVCRGSDEACRRLADDHAVRRFAEHAVPFIHDEEGQIARSFMISGTPEAISLGSDARVKRYGRPIPNEEEQGIGPADDSAFASTSETTGRLHSAREEAVEETDRAEIKRAPGGDDAEPCLWPDDRPFTGASFARVDTKVSCVMTRFQLRSAWSLIPFYLAFRRVRRSAVDVAGLLKAVFLIEDLHTCYTMSIWKDDCAIVDFGNVKAHIMAANSAFAPTYRKDMMRAEIWSAQFRLWAVSSHNLNWDGLDLRTVLADQWGRVEEVARGD
jgi:hypothetical protein